MKMKQIDKKTEKVKKFKSAGEILDYRTRVAKRIDRKYGAFSYKARVLHEENLRRLSEELKEFINCKKDLKEPRKTKT